MEQTPIRSRAGSNTAKISKASHNNIEMNLDWFSRGKTSNILKDVPIDNQNKVIFYTIISLILAALLYILSFYF